MKFIVAPEIFDLFPAACFGVVVAKGFPQGDQPAVADKLAASLAAAGANFPDGVKSHPYIAAWRDAFTKLGLNPNKFASSVEALHTRAFKTGHIPSINSVVDLGNAVSLKHILPIGAHDIGRMAGDIHLRLSRPGDIFTPFGSPAAEEVPPGEIVYADGLEVRTRRWVWRQGDKAKIEADSRDIFFPIDGFADLNKNAVLAARDELTAAAASLGCKTETFFLDKNNPTADWSD
ncbi:B3/4 domain-containing protein [Anaeroselena agilis]|uniref:Phenylalanine--tRNA ligase beta subunit-related protein n=1 Tax=Anaeroselena agilis TaxID=3063788 RepID=A0ABU3P178_9FIRM|nr:phenylalanine--tRNA ligase beta subunit-related protein [Selenomonadales bacterium 4137-cl]